MSIEPHDEERCLAAFETFWAGVQERPDFRAALQEDLQRAALQEGLQDVPEPDRKKAMAGIRARVFKKYKAAWVEGTMRERARILGIYEVMGCTKADDFRRPEVVALIDDPDMTPGKVAVMQTRAQQDRERGIFGSSAPTGDAERLASMAPRRRKGQGDSE